MIENRLIDEIDVYKLLGQTGIARIHVSDIDLIKRIDPETLSIVQNLRDQLENLKKERGTAINQLHGYCHACKNYTENHCEWPCENCNHEYYQYRDENARDNWEWIGINKDG